MDDNRNVKEEYKRRKIIVFGAIGLLLIIGITIPVFTHLKDRIKTKTVDIKNTVNYYHTVAETTIKETTTSEEELWENLNIVIPEIDESVYSKLSYNDFSEQIDVIMDENGYEELERFYIKSVLDGVYQNYNDWRTIRKGWPSREYFISNYLIDPLEYCTLHFVEKERDAEEWKTLDDSGAAYGFTDEHFCVTIMCDREEELEAPHLFDSVLQSILHELGHVTQRKVLWKDHFGGHSYLMEGWATVLMDVVNQPKTEKTGGGYVPFSEEVSINYEADDGTGYPTEGNLTNQLICLVGFETIEAVMNGKPVGVIFRKISEKYGLEKAEKMKDLLETIDNVIEADYDTVINDYHEEALCTVSLENEFLDCIEKDISDLTTKQEVEEYTNIYRSYMINLLPRVKKDTYTDITDEYLPKVKELNDVMAEKIKATGAFGFEKLSVAKALVSCTTTEWIRRPSDVFFYCYVPLDLKKTRYIDNESGLYLSYVDITCGDEQEVCICIDKDNTITACYQKPDGMKPLYPTE